MSITDTVTGTRRAAGTSHVIQTLKAEFARHDKTQREVGALLGITQAAVSRRMRGEVLWTVDELLRVAAWLNIPPARFLDAA